MGKNLCKILGFLDKMFCFGFVIVFCFPRDLICVKKRSARRALSKFSTVQLEKKLHGVGAYQPSSPAGLPAEEEADSTTAAAPGSPLPHPAGLVQDPYSTVILEHTGA